MLFRSQLKAQAMSIFKSLDIGSFFAPANAGGYDTSMMQFADGGEPPVGRPSLIRERGPELFIPKTAGTVIPNHTLQSVLGGNQPTQVFNGPYIENMQAIDTKSFEERLYGSSNAVWAANQYANKSLAAVGGRS